MVTKNSEEHKTFLIEMYHGIKMDVTSTRFEKLVFENAVNKLKNGIKPTSVEDWVVKVEKLWRKMLK